MNCRSSRRPRTAWWLTLSISVLVSGCGPTEQIDRIVLVTIDTLRADHLGSYGYPRPTSPFLDSVAARGVRFERAISASSHTAPSHASMFTSLYPTRHGVVRNGMRLAGEPPTLASTLAAEGFTTGAVTSVRFLKSVTAAFDVFHGPRRGLYRPADRTVDVALDWLETLESSDRFLLWIHLFDVHESDPEVGDKPHLASHLENLRAHGTANSHALSELLEHEHGISPALLREDLDRVHRYDAQIRFVDSQLKRLFDRLDGDVRREATLWIFTSDHGEGLGSHGYLGHGKHLYREQLRVPLILFGAGIAEGRYEVDSLIRTVDLLPTVLDLAEISPPAAARDWEGVSFAAELRGRGAGSSRPRIAYAERRPVDAKRLAAGWTNESMFMARDARSKFILRSGGDNEFYDLISDPLESENLAGGGSDAEERLARWLVRKVETLKKTAPRANESPEVEEEFVDELRSLGYLD